MQRPIYPSFGRVKTIVDVEIWEDGWWTGKKIKEQKKVFQNIDIVSYALEVSVSGVTCVFVVHFRSSDTFFKFVNS